MTQHDSKPVLDSTRSTTLLSRVTRLGMQLVGAAALAGSAATAIAKRKKNKSGRDAESDRESRREDRREARRAEREEQERAEKRDAREERREARQENSGRDQDDNDNVVEKRQSNNRNNRNNNDDDDDEDGGGGNDRGNAGSGFFDNPLASKDRRRANDFDNNRGRDDEPGGGRTGGAVDDDGTQTFDTNSISFTNGPDGLEIVTRNIEYSAPPTPTPTPFPTLQFPERDRLDVFGDRVIAAPTPAPTNGGTSAGSPPPASDSGTNVTTGVRPSPAPPSDTSGGDNTSDFLS